MRLFNKVAIVGTGLIGGSLALAMKKKRLVREVIGVSRHKNNLLLAKKRGAIDQGSLKLDIIKDADLLVLAMPVDVIIDSASAISKIAKSKCLVIDVGSTKKEIVSHLEKFFPNYIGTHPLAGSEKRSVAYADPDIFKDSVCILTPTKNTKNKSLNKIKKLWVKVGSKVVLLTPQMHDKVLSFTSHLPHIAAFSLMNAVPEKDLGFVATGLRDTTRIAGSDSALWASVFLSNRNNLLEAINSLQKELTRIKLAIQRNNKKSLSAILKKAQAKRSKLQKIANQN
jgi:prephenate dehydrogenase